jgi:hypothetical protein
MSPLFPPVGSDVEAVMLRNLEVNAWSPVKVPPVIWIVVVAERTGGFESESTHIVPAGSPRATPSG